MRGRFLSRAERSTSNLALLLSFVFAFPAAFCPDQAKAGNDEKKLLQLHNRERLKRKIPRLRRRGALSAAAQKYAQMMDEHDHFSHTGPYGSSFSDRIKQEAKGLKAMGENLAFGQRSPKAVHKAWMKSAGHRRNILSRNFKYIGFGKAGDEPFWASNFGG